MAIIRCAVIGAGHLGRFHAQKYAQLPDVELVAVVDCDMTRARAVADECGARAHATVRDVLDQVDVVSIVVPTAQHYAIARSCIEAGVHVLVEKPLASDPEQARELVRLARQQRCVLQVGHLERFNPALLALTEGQWPLQPLFIESHRLAPFKPRSTDVDVVLDLMIHDIDIILSLVRSPLESVVASGARVLTPHTDIANTRLVFANGCVANVTASRASLKSERKMRFFLPELYASVDFQQCELVLCRLGHRESHPGVPEIACKRESFGQVDALQAEVASFVAAVRGECPVVVSGADGLCALEVAERVTAQLQGSAQLGKRQGEQK